MTLLATVGAPLVPLVVGLVQVTLDLLGVFVFALSGALVAVRVRLDVVGILVLAEVTGLGGGIVRDLLIGDVPPASLLDWRYLLVPVAAGLIGFRFHPGLGKLERAIIYADAVGLGLFCVTGSLKALQFGVPPAAAVLMGVLTGVGGGLLRDIMVARRPVVLREDVYVLPALAGSVVLVAAWEVGWYWWWVEILAVSLCIVLRALAIHYRWQAPQPE